MPNVANTLLTIYLLIPLLLICIHSNSQVSSYTRRIRIRVVLVDCQNTDSGRTQRHCCSDPLCCVESRTCITQRCRCSDPLCFIESHNGRTQRHRCFDSLCCIKSHSSRTQRHRCSDLILCAQHREDVFGKMPISLRFPSKLRPTRGTESNSHQSHRKEE
jgi:hypothetical protein